MDLRHLKRVTEAWLRAKEVYKQTGQGEDKAEAAFNEFVLGLDGHTVEKLIEAFEQASEIVKLFAWLKENRLFVERPGHHQLEFTWIDIIEPSRSLEKAIADAMTEKPRIARV